MTKPPPPRSLETLATWLRQRIAEYARISPDEVDFDAPLAAYGLDSIYALTLSEEIEEYLGVVVSATIVWDTPTINALVHTLEATVATAQLAAL
jgi:aryl carrier-like protein